MEQNKCDNLFTKIPSVLVQLFAWYFIITNYYLKCCQGFEDGNVALQSYVITKFYQFFPTTNLNAQKKTTNEQYREIRT